MSASVTDGTPVAQYTVHYGDGTVETIPVVYGEDVRDWWDIDNSKAVCRGKVAWEGNNPAARRSQWRTTIRLYLTMWKNLHPGKKVVSIDYISKNTTAPPFCVAMTIEGATGDATQE
jgi:hypothetical protein